MLDKGQGSLYNGEKKGGPRHVPIRCRSRPAAPETGESVQYAKEQGGLYVRQDGRQFWSQDSASRLYLELNTAGMGKRQNSAPKSVPDAELEFGNGCILRLWEQDVWDGYNRKWVPGVFVWYQGADGTNYMYDTDQVRWQVLGKWVPGE